MSVQNTASRGTGPMGTLKVTTIERNSGIESLTTFTSLGARGDLATKSLAQSTAA